MGLRSEFFWRNRFVLGYWSGENVAMGLCSSNEDNLTPQEREQRKV